MAASALSYSLPTMISVDLMMAVTWSPSLRPRASAEPRVMADVSNFPLPMSIVISAMTLPIRTAVTRPASWLRALIRMMSSSVHSERTTRAATGIHWPKIRSVDRFSTSQVEATECYECRSEPGRIIASVLLSLQFADGERGHLPNPAREALVTGRDDAQRPFRGARGRSIATVGEEDGSIAEGGIELGDRKHGAVAIGRSDDDCLGNARPTQVRSQLDTCPAEKVCQQDS